MLYSIDFKIVCWQS